MAFNSTFCQTKFKSLVDTKLVNSRYNNGNYVGNFEILHFWVCQSIESKLLAINLKTKKCLNINALVTEVNQKYGAPYC